MPAEFAREPSEMNFEVYAYRHLPGSDENLHFARPMKSAVTKRCIHAGNYSNKT
jgi:hypothetical protein